METVRIAIDHVTWDAYTRHFKARAYMGYSWRYETLDWGCLGRGLERSRNRDINKVLFTRAHSSSGC